MEKAFIRGNDRAKAGTVAQISSGHRCVSRQPRYCIVVAHLQTRGIPKKVAGWQARLMYTAGPVHGAEPSGTKGRRRDTRYAPGKSFHGQQAYVMGQEGWLLGCSKSGTGSNSASASNTLFGKQNKSPTGAYRAPTHALTLGCWSSFFFSCSTIVVGGFTLIPLQQRTPGPRTSRSRGHGSRSFCAATGEIQRIPARVFSSIPFSLPGSSASRSRCQPLA